MKNLIAILSFGVLLSSCNKTENTKVSDTKSDSIETKKEFAIDSLRVQDSVQIAKTLTLSFEKQILLFPDITNKTLLDSIYKPANITSPEYSKQALSAVLEKLKAASLKKDESQDYMPEFKQTWEDMSGMKLISNQDNVLTLQYAGNGYSGGAHGYYFESYKTFDLKNNKVISQNDIFKNPTDVNF